MVEQSLNIVRVFPAFQETLKYAEHHLAERLSSMGHRLTFVSTDLRWSTWGSFLKDDFQLGEHQRDSYRLVRFRSLKLFDKGIPFNLSRFSRRVFSGDVDVIHCVGLGAPITLAVLAAARSRKNKIRIVVSDHSNAKTAKRTGRAAGAYHRAMRLALEQLGDYVDEIITYSDESRDFVSVRYGVSPERFRVIPLGFDDNVFYCRPGREDRSPEKFHLGFAGKIDANKQLDRLIRACAESRFRDRIQLTLAGAESTQDSPLISMLRKLAKESGVNLTVFPLLSPVELAEFYNSLDLAVFPGSISVTTIEASGCGVPILLNRSIDGLECRVSDGRGSLFDTDRQLVSLLDSQLSIGPVGQDQRMVIAEKTRAAFAWSSVVHEYLDAYRIAG